MRCGTILPISKSVIDLMIDNELIAHAEKVALTCAKNGRTLEERVLNLIPSLAVEKATLAYLRTLGYIVNDPPSDTFQYDGIVDDVLVDVKTRFDGKYWQQTPWEVSKLKQTGENVLYLCVDLMPTEEFIFRGCTWGHELKTSNYGQPYAYTSLLKDLFPPRVLDQQV